MPPSTMADQTMADLLSAISTDTTQVGTDNANISADQAKLAADQAALATDTTTLSTDEATFGAALAQTGPLAVLSADGSSVTVYTPTTGSDFSTSSIPIASSVAIPAAPIVTPTPTPTVGS